MRKSTLLAYYYGIPLMLLISLRGYGQGNLFRTELPDQFINNHYLLNPANSDSTYGFAIKIGNKAETGLFQGVNKIYADGDWRIKAGVKGSMHHVGVFVFNNREGNFINRTRLYGRYGWRLRLSSRSSISTGVSLGFINYSFRSSQAGVGGSDLKPDGNLGVWYLRPNTGIGISLQHLSEPDLQPVFQRFKIKRYGNVLGYQKIAFSPFINLNASAFASFDATFAIHGAVAGVAEVYDKVEAGVVYVFPGHALFMVGLKNIRLGDCLLHFSFSYLVETGKLTIRDNAIEIFGEIRQ